MSEKNESTEIVCADGTKVRISDFREATAEELALQRIDLDEFRKLDEAATPRPWTQWVEHGKLFAGEVKENLPYVISGDTVEIVECFGDELADEGQDGLFPTTVSSATDDAALVAFLRNNAPTILNILERVRKLAEVDALEQAEAVDSAIQDLVDAGNDLLTPRHR